MFYCILISKWNKHGKASPQVPEILTDHDGVVKFEVLVAMINEITDLRQIIVLGFNFKIYVTVDSCRILL